MDTCTLVKQSNKYKGIPSRLISCISAYEEVKKRTNSNETSDSENDLPLCSHLIGKVSHKGVIHVNWSFLRY